MADKETEEGTLEALTAEEQKVLAKALKKVEVEVFHKVLKRLSAWGAVIISIMFVGGLINLNSCSSNIEANAVQKLAADPELRDKIADKAQRSVANVQEQLAAASRRAAELERNNARAEAAFMDDLQQIRSMLKRIRDELQTQKAGGGERPQAGGEAK